MGQRRKNRTHLKGARAPKNNAELGKDNLVPKTFILRHGQVGFSMSQLVRDMRKVMEPNTASRLKERSRNKLKDFITIAPALNVTHLLAFTLTPTAPSLRIVRLSNGPTLSFRIERYSLIKDVMSASRHARSMGTEYLSPPLLVLASFPAPGPNAPHMPLLIKSFQTLFPPLAPKTLSLSSCRRVVLVSWNSDTSTVDFRHYIITVRAHGVSRKIRKAIEGANKSSSSRVLDLGNEQDVADYLLRSMDEDGYETASTSAASEVDAEETAVRLAGDYVGRNNKKGERRAVRLSEIGPRMELKLVKITEGPPGKEGAVLFHEFVTKTPEEAALLKSSAAQRAKLKRERREQQERNVAQKKDSKNQNQAASNDDDDDEANDVFSESDGNEDWGDDAEMSEADAGEGSSEGDEEVTSDEELSLPALKRPRPNRMSKGKVRLPA